MARPSSVSSFALLGLVCCGAAPPTGQSSPDDTQPAAPLAATPRTEAGYLAGVEHFALLAAEQPVMGLVARQAAQEGLLFCEDAKSSSTPCREATVARLTSLLREPTPVVDIPLPDVTWRIKAPTSCAAVVNVLGEPAPTGRMRGAIVLEQCRFSSTQTPWVMGRCLTSSQCQVDRVPERGASQCADARPCPPPPPSCDCFTATRVSRLELRGRATFNGQVQPFSMARDGKETIAQPGSVPPTELSDASPARIAEMFLGRGDQLPLASRALAILVASGPDELALECTLALSRPGRDVFGVTALASERCRDVYLRKGGTR